MSYWEVTNRNLLLQPFLLDSLKAEFEGVSMPHLIEAIYRPNQRPYMATWKSNQDQRSTNEAEMKAKIGLTLCLVSDAKTESAL